MARPNGNSQVVSLVLLVILGVIVWQRQALADWFKLHDYQPPVAISKLAQEDTMTAAAQHLYYVNHPQLISSSDQFSQLCQQHEQTIVLGCYRSGESGIYLRSVADSRLTGVEEVTAAHEMLHGAYERLSDSERRTVDSELLDYYNHDLHDQRLIDVMNAYKQTEPNAVVDEMHSVFGTEVANLPAPLEAYYKRYFINRQDVTTFAAGYEQEFTSLQDQIKSYEAQLNQLKATIDDRENSLNAQNQQLQQQRAQLDSMRAAGNYTAYNAQVASFNQAVDAYNSGVEQLKANINRYNVLVDQHNQVATELSSLYSSLGTNLSTEQSQ